MRALALTLLLVACVTPPGAPPLDKLYRCMLVENEEQAVVVECLDDPQAWTDAWAYACADRHAGDSFVCFANCHWLDHQLC